SPFPQTRESGTGVRPRAESPGSALGIAAVGGHSGKPWFADRAARLFAPRPKSRHPWGPLLKVSSLHGPLSRNPEQVFITRTSVHSHRGLSKRSAFCAF